MQQTQNQDTMIADGEAGIRVIGLISGTSVDGIDAVLVELRGRRSDLQVQVLAAQTYPYAPELRSQILAVCGGEPLSVAALAQLDEAIAQAFAAAARSLQLHHSPAHLIGSHGQTVFHAPPQGSGEGLRLGYSLQLGRGSTIAHLTGLPTVSNFRAADIAAGGQGAPLVPPIDACLFGHPTRDRCVQNLGGIGNVTVLPAGCAETLTGVRGWDTGPANVLVDLAVAQLTDGAQTYDADGAWAASGTPDLSLVQQWLSDRFFLQPPPKSTGREYFGVEFLQQCRAEASELSAADWLATLTELTAASVADSYRRFLPRLPDEVLLCGGGSRNGYLRSRLQHYLPGVTLRTTDALGIDGDWKEAIAFAVLADWHCRQLPGNLPSVTGARRVVVLGDCSHPVSETSTGRDRGFSLDS